MIIPYHATNRSNVKPRPITWRQAFVRAGEKAKVHKTEETKTRILDTANDWVLLVDDVPTRIVFPTCTGVDTTLRPDVIIYSKTMKIIIWGELTVPLEENMNAAATRKRKRYSLSTKDKLSLTEQCKRNGWTVHDFTFEVGSLGWTGHSTRRFLSKLGFKNSQLKWIRKRIERITQRSSYLIWNCRTERQWEPPEMVPLRVPTTGLHNTNPPVPTQQNKNKNKKESSQALHFLATRISFNINVEPNPATPPRRSPPPQPRPAPTDFEYDYETLAEEAEDFDDQYPPSPFGPDGPDAGPEHPMLF